MTHVTCRLIAKNRDQLRNSALGSRVRATFLAPSDFYWFPLLKEQLRGRQFSSDNEVIASVEEFVDWQQSQDELSYKTGTQKLQKQCNKCIEVCGDYV